MEKENVVVENQENENSVMEEVELDINEVAIENREEKEEKEKKQDLDKLSIEELKKLVKENKKKIKELESDKSKLENELNSTKESWLRTAADFDNFRKRNQDTRINSYKEGKIDTITNILVVGDNLDRALSMNLDEKTKEGISMTAKRFQEILANMGVTEINPVGEDFDPLTQDAIMKVDAEEGEEKGKVKQVFLKGYKLGDKVIRFAQVVVIG